MGNMQNRIVLTLMILIIGLNTQGFSQSYIPKVGVPTPVSIEDYQRCDQEMVGVFDTRTFKACIDGQKQARYTAEQFALTNGKLHGYLEGFSYAIYQATQVNSSHAEEAERGRQALYANGANMQAGIDEGIQSGIRLGKQLGQADAVALWDRAFENGQIPKGNANTYYNDKIPEFNLSFRSPYEHFVGKRTVDQILREDIDKTLRNVVVSIPNNDVYLVGNNSYNIWDLWFDNGHYEVERYKSGGWINPVKSFDFWQKHSEKLGQYDINSYSNLPTAYTDQVATTEKEVKMPDGTTRTVKEKAIINLKEIFKDGFLESYRYYMHHNFNKGFHEYLKLGAFAGEAVGIQVGKRIAYESGYAEAYDNKFWYEAEKAYIISYKKAYAEAFDKVHIEYSENAILSILNLETIGEVNDGILSPGEQVKFSLTIENRGAVNTPDLKLNIAGDVNSAVDEKLGLLGSFETKVFETGFLIKISEGHDVRENIQLEFRFQGSGAYDMFYDAKIDIRNQIESIGRAYFQSLNVVEGRSLLVLPIKNVSTRAAHDIVAEGTVKGKMVAISNLGTVEGSEEQMASLSLIGLDPLGLIDGIPAKIQMKANGTRIIGAEGDVLIKSQNPIKDISAIYLMSVKENGYETVSREQVESKLLTLNSGQVVSVRRGANLYRINAGVTLPGQLVLQRVKGSATTDEALNNLAVKMWLVNRKSLPAFLSSKRKYYRKLLDQLTISGSVKKEAKGK